MRTFLIKTFFLFSILIFLAFIAVQISEINSIKKSKHWIETPATITKYDLIKEHTRRKGTYYCYNLSLTYIFDNKIYYKDNIKSYGLNKSHPLSCKKSPIKIAIEKTNIYANPFNPTEVILEKDSPTNLYISLIICIIVVAIMTFLLFTPLPTSR